MRAATKKSRCARVSPNARCSSRSRISRGVSCSPSRGFRVHTDQPYNDKQRWIELRVGNAPTSLVLFTADGDADFIGRGFHGSLVCDKLEQTYEELVAKGVEFVAPPTKAPWGAFAVFKDIDDNRFVMSAA